MQIFISLCFAVLFGFAGVQASFSNALSGFTSTMSGIGNGFKQFGEGMAQSFGAAPSGYHYSFRVFNNTVADTVTVSWNNIVEVQGMIFNTGASGATIQTLFPCTDTGSLYSRIKLYLEVNINFNNGAGSYSDTLANAMQSYADPSTGLAQPVYWYNVYTQVDTVQGKRSIIGPHVEMMGCTGPNSPSAIANPPVDQFLALSNDFNGLFYNVVNQQNSILFSYTESTSNTKKYTVTMDPMSFNFLTNDSLLINAIRPIKGTSSITFSSNGLIPMSSQNTITLAPETFGPGIWDKTTNQAILDTSGGGNTALRSNYEIIENDGSLEVIQTGFQPGNFLVNSTNAASGVSPINAPGSINNSTWSIIPISSQMRDITPVRCLIWNQSAAQWATQLAALNAVVSGATNAITSDGTSGNELLPFDDPNSTLWFVYYSPGWSTDSQVKSNGVLQTASNGVTWAAPKSMPGLLLGQVPSGQAVSFSIIRPPLNHKCSLTPLEGAQWTLQDVSSDDTSTPPPAAPASPSTPSAPLPAGSIAMSGMAPAMSNLTPAAAYTAVPSFLPLTASLASAARLSVVSLNTTDPVKAQQFLINLASEKIKFTPFTPPTLSASTSKKLAVPTMTYAQRSSLLAKSLPNNANYLIDPSSGVTGILLVTDIFSSYGAGNGPYYYTLYPPQFDITIPVNSLINYFTSTAYSTIITKDSSGNYPAYTTLMDNVAGWILTALKNPSTAQSSLTTAVMGCLQTNGINQLFTSTGSGSSATINTNVLSAFGTSVVQQIINGPGGLAHPLKFYMSGMNNWLTSGTDVPTLLQTSNGETYAAKTSAWNPANTVPVG